jgi:hypothetical protein
MGTLNTETKNYTIGRGDLFFAKRKADGTLSGERPIGNTPDFAFTVSSDTLKHYSSSQGMRVQDREVPVQTDYAASFTTDDVNPMNLEALLLGEASIVAITSATALTEDFTDVETGLTYQIGISTSAPAGLQNLDNISVDKGATPLVEGTDFTVDAALGRITLLTTGSTVVDGDDITVTYDRLAASQNRVASGATVVEGALRFIANNPEGDNINYYLPDVKLSPNGDFQVKVDNDWQKMPFKVSVNTPTNGSAIYADGRPYTPA